jgi:hypothetical protein
MKSKDRYVAVYKTGEKPAGVFNTRGRKPLGFMRYIEPWKGAVIAWEYIPNIEKSYRPKVDTGLGALPHKNKPTKDLTLEMLEEESNKLEGLH